MNNQQKRLDARGGRRKNNARFVTMTRYATVMNKATGKPSIDRKTGEEKQVAYNVRVPQ